MKMIRSIIITILALSTVIASAADKSCRIRRLGEEHSIVTATTGDRYILLPIQENAPESRIVVINDNVAKSTINVHLAKDKMDYYMPLEIAAGDAMHIHVPFDGKSSGLHSADNIEDGIWAEHIKTADSYDVPDEPFRPEYHFTPVYGWMNDPNGMVYKDGVWHLYYQWNPYASVWGNMTWGHASSTDLVHWTQHDAAITPDAVGAIFSGSCVVDHNNSAGFGKDAIIAFYTSAAESQTQSMAYSTDGGMTFKKYSGNPIITSRMRDFRDPKVMWYEPGNYWVMSLAAGQEIQFYSSVNLKDWKFESSFGTADGCHDGVWECPDLVELPIEGTDKTRWVLLVNINPGGPFGGSATQYFVGYFDGHKFVNDTPGDPKWMDYGKDHYATVTWSNAPEKRCVAIAWMNNWQYANVVPATYYSSATSVPRELTLFEAGGDVFLKSSPVKELDATFVPVLKKRSFKAGKTPKSFVMPADAKSSFAFEFTVSGAKSGETGIVLSNTTGEKVIMTLSADTCTVDRTKSGATDFSEHFGAVVSTPVFADGSEDITLKVFVDKSSVEVFGNGGRFVLTNLVFPSEPYGKVEFFAKWGKIRIKDLKFYDIK